MKTKSNARRLHAPALSQGANADEFADFVLDDEGDWDWRKSHGNCSENRAEQSVQSAGFMGHRFAFYGVRIRTRRLH